MEVVLLGSGAADGWPNPFCRCDSCMHAARTGTIRGQTSALVDDVLMLDCGPEAPSAAVRHGRSLADVRYILLTHAHVDHLGPQALLFRSWIADNPLLEVIGTPDTLDACRPWVGPDDPVAFREVAAGDQVSLGDYTIRVLPAQHKVFREGDAVLYDVTGPAGDRLLWACDTGVWPREWFDAVAGAAYDSVFLEETFGEHGDLSSGHLGFEGYSTMLTGLREVDAVTEQTDVVAVHLGHHNPPEPRLRERLRTMGSRPGTDGEVISVGLGIRAAKGHRTLVLGGVRSGKSVYAERLVANAPAVTYLATGGMRDGDTEWAERVATHRDRRPSSWTTLETTDIADVIVTATTPILVDCLGTWLTARMDAHRIWDGGDVRRVDADIADLLDAWSACPTTVVAVSNEVGSGVVPATASGRLFRDLLGKLNTEIANASESVVLLVAGQPVTLR